MAKRLKSPGLRPASDAQTFFEFLRSIIGGDHAADANDAGHGRTAVSGRDQGFDCCLLADDQRLDSAVVAVSDPAAQPVPAGFLPNPEPETDALDPAGDDEAKGDRGHRPLRRIRG